MAYNFTNNVSSPNIVYASGQFGDNSESSERAFMYPRSSRESFSVNNPASYDSYNTRASFSALPVLSDSRASFIATDSGSYDLNNTRASFSIGRGEGNSRIMSDLISIASSSVSNSENNTSITNYSVSLSAIEAAILRSTVPIEITETDEITVLGQRGIWANKSEVINWRGPIPIEQYIINEDQNPEIISKKVSQVLEYVQELAIRYLRPPTPPAPGDIVIVQEANIPTAPAPPLIIRQQPARPDTPEPLVFREAPPQPPAVIGRKVITISGKRIPPPPRKVVIERLAPLPSKPQSVIIERWLPYAQLKRRVIFQANTIADPVVAKPRNVIVQWEQPEIAIRKEIKYLGVIRADPIDYVHRFGSSLKKSAELPQYVLDIKTPDGLVLAANYQYNSVHELEGEVQALGLVDLDREGLSEYRTQLLSFNRIGRSASISVANSVTGVIDQIFSAIDKDGSGTISFSEAESILLKLNSRLGRNYGSDDVERFFRSVDKNYDGSLNLKEFRLAFERFLSQN